MKLVLTNFGQDISLVGDIQTVYLVFTDEESGRVFRLPSTPETVGRLAAIHAGEYTGEPTDGEPEEEAAEEEEPEEAPEEEPEAAEEPEPPPVPVLPRPTLRKRIPTPSPTQQMLAKVRSRLEDHQDESGEEDDGVPSL